MARHISFDNWFPGPPTTLLTMESSGTCAPSFTVRWLLYAHTRPFVICRWAEIVAHSLLLRGRTISKSRFLHSLELVHWVVAPGQPVKIVPTSTCSVSKWPWLNIRESLPPDSAAERDLGVIMQSCVKTRSHVDTLCSSERIFLNAAYHQYGKLRQDVFSMLRRSCIHSYDVW